MDTEIRELVELAINKISSLEKRLEKYFEILLRRNELDFILNGGYVLESEIDEIITPATNDEVSLNEEEGEL